MHGLYTLIGDPHVKHDNLDKIESLFELVEEMGKPAVMLGDIFDTKEVIRGKALNLVYRLLKKSKLKWIILVGNHDWFNLECKDHSLVTLGQLKNVTIVDKPKEIDGVHYFPYEHDQKKLKRWLKKVPDGSVVIGHFDINTFKMGNVTCQDGLDPVALKRFKLVISGHYHSYQSNGNIVYLGTPFSHSFTSSNEIKYLATYDVGRDIFQLEETPFPKHVTLEINCDEEIGAILTSDRNIYRFILTGKQENIDKFPKDKFPEVKIISRPTEEFQNDILVEDTMSNVDQFEKWASDIKALDESTIKLGREILEAVK